MRDVAGRISLSVSVTPHVTTEHMMRQTKRSLAAPIIPFTKNDEQFVQENRLVSMDAVLSVLPTKNRQTLYRWIKDGLFPPPLKIAGAMIAFRESEIVEWLNTRPRALGGDKKVRRERHQAAQT